MDLIRGREVNQALATLQFTRKSVAHDIEKVLRSAIANAQQKEGFGGDVDRLYVLGLLREPGAVDEARASGADGPRVPRGEAHDAPDGEGGRAAAEDQGGRRRAPGAGARRAGSAKKAAPGARAKKAGV